MISLTGLWEGEDKNGNKMLSSKLTAFSKVFVFKNTNKKNEKEPDYYLKIAAIEKEPSTQGVLGARETSTDIFETPF